MTFILDLNSKKKWEEGFIEQIGTINFDIEKRINDRIRYWNNNNL